MANENNYCACNDGDAHYIIELNQQGAPGQQGEAGAEGFSPEIVYTITDTEFVVKVVNKDGITETPNLFNDYIAKKDLSNTNIANEYLKIDGSNASGSMSLNVPVSTGNLTVNGYLTTPANRDATIYRINTRSIQVDSVAGEMALGSKCKVYNNGAIIYTHPGDNIGYELVNQADIPAVYNSTITLTQGGVTKGSFTLNQSTGATIDLDAGGSSTYTAGTGIDITDNTISIDNTVALKSEIPTSSDYVDLTSNQTIGGSKTFSSQIHVNSGVLIDGLGAGVWNSYDGTNYRLFYCMPTNNVIIGATQLPTIISGSTTRPYYQDNTKEIALVSDIPTSNDIEAHKAYKSTGELLTDSKGLADVKEYAHSTFDVSKFTVVGSPTITDDGIVSGFSNSNYINIPFTSTKNFTVSYKCNPGAYNTGSYCDLFQLVGIGSMYFNANSTTLTMSYKDNTNTTKYASLGTVNESTNYLFDIKIAGASTEIVITNLSTSVSTTTALPAFTTDYSNLTGITLKNGQNISATLDLKQFSIRVDGVEVFSGNRTGIDTIKPDDYTVVGTPTISADGVASGFSNSNYITLNNTQNLTLSKPYEIDINVTFQTSNVQTIMLTDSSATNGFRTSTSNNMIRMELWTGGSSKGGLTGYIFSPNKSYDVKLTFDGVDKYNCYYKESSASIYTQGSTITSSSTITLASDFYLMKSSTGATGIVDLNSIHIYIDGNLAYQPCLKIPYTLSKTGSKIVDSVYRNRVNDCAEQFGQANYYTLDEVNNNFTLPQIELYGLIGQRTLKDTYRNGIFYYDLYSDRTLEQGGSCTSGTDVTFLKPFSDTNYVLTVPYSAKTTTGFTPSATGDWIAKGIGEL